MVPELSPGRAIGPYTIEGLLGRTRWGATYAAVGNGRHVALKVLDPIVAQQPGVHDELRRARASIGTDGGFLATYEDVEDETVGSVLVAPLSEDPSLGDLVDIFPLTPEETVALLASLATALESAHRVGVAHLALKPTNLFIGPPPEHAVRLGDVGADVLRRASRAIHGSHGSLAWLAPEQLDSDAKPTVTADVFVAGLLAFFAMTGKPLWREVEQDDEDALVAELRAPRMKPSELAMELGADVSTALDQALMKALAPEPTDRYSSVGALAAALANALAMSPREATVAETEALAQAPTSLKPAQPASASPAPEAPASCEEELTAPPARQTTSPVPALQKAASRPPPAARHFKATQKLHRFSNSPPPADDSSSLPAVVPAPPPLKAAALTAKMAPFPGPEATTKRMARFANAGVPSARGAPQDARAQARPGPVRGAGARGQTHRKFELAPADALAPGARSIGAPVVLGVLVNLLALGLVAGVIGIVMGTCSSRSPARASAPAAVVSTPSPSGSARPGRP